jgi:hypothetical protein
LVKDLDRGLISELSLRTIKSGKSYGSDDVLADVMTVLETEQFMVGGLEVFFLLLVIKAIISYGRIIRLRHVLNHHD